MVIISMVVTCDSSAIIKYDKRRLGLPSTPLNLKYDNNSI